MARSNQGESAVLASSDAFLLPFAALSAKEEIDEKPSSANAAPPEIPDLPDELLLMIFKHAKGGTNNRNVRLSCRRFRDTSSHLLLDSINVCLSPASLARAHEISCHPTISKGIRALNVSLKSHGSPFSNRSFLTSAINHLRDDIKGALEYSVKYQDAILEGKECAIAAHFVPLWRQRKRLLRSWEKHPRRNPSALSIFDPREQTPESEALRQGHEKYKLASEWQQRTLQDGTFAQAIATMMGRMPLDTQKQNLKLRFTDTSSYREDVLTNPHRYPWRSHNNAFEVFDDRMLWSMGASCWEPQDKMATLAIQVPLAIHAAGPKAVEIGFHFSTHLKTPFQFEPIQKRKAAAENLGVFSFKLQWPMTCHVPLSRETSAIEHLGAVLVAANIQSLTISWGSCSHPGGHREWCLGALLASLPWRHLREVNLRHVSFHLADLKTFIGRLQPNVFLNLTSTGLLSGGWAEGLDILRAKADSKSRVDQLVGDQIPYDRYKRIFCGDESSWASRYVQGVFNRNPFLVIENEEPIRSRKLYKR